MGSIPNGEESGYAFRDQPIHANRLLRVVCVGAGASGLCLAYKLKHYFTDFELDLFEKNSDIGGTWFDLPFPDSIAPKVLTVALKVREQIPWVHNYTYSFEPNPDWSANYATSSEIFQYFSNFATKYGLREYISCQHQVVGAKWHDERAEWVVKVRKADGHEFEKPCDFLINGGGILNKWEWPNIAGIDTFEGQRLHSAAWDESADLRGKRVGLIGNGSSGIQILPQLQKQASHVSLFVRGPTWVTPSTGMEYHRYSEEEKRKFREEQGALLEMRRATERGMNNLFPLLIRKSATQQAASQYMAGLMKDKIGDNEIAKLLIPDFPFGCRRITPGVGYLESLTAPNVTVIKGAVNQVTPKGIVSDVSDEEVPLDALVCATGFITNFRPLFPLVGRSGIELAQAWAKEPRNYLSIAVSSFPNYFMFLGPNCPIANGPIIVSIETQTEYMAKFMTRWQKEDIRSFDVRPDAVDDFMQHKDNFMETTVWSTGCNSWYKDPNSGKITAVWPGSTLHYMEAMANPRYEDFVIKTRGNRFQYLGNGFSQRELNDAMDSTFYLRNQDQGETICPTLESRVNAKSASKLVDELVQGPV